MKYLSVCSGIEAATTAWHQLGWKPVAFSEIEPFPSAVLAHHWPDVPNLGDMTKYHDWRTDDIQLLVGGTPCQAFSVAGLRKGLADPRGNLTLTFLGILEKYLPRWVVWENVPGVLSDKTGAFGSFLGGLSELGYGWAYRVLDAQHFGVPQRRRRVFVVGCLGNWAAAAAVLFESESLRWHPSKGRKTRKRTTSTLARGLEDRGIESTQVENGSRAISPSLKEWPAKIAPTLPALFAEKLGLDDQHAFGGAGLFVETNNQIISLAHGQANADLGFDMSPTITCLHEAPIIAKPVEIGPSGGRFTEVNPTLDSRAKDGPIRNQLAGAVLQSVPTEAAAIGIDIYNSAITGDVFPTLTAKVDDISSAVMVPNLTQEVTNSENGNASSADSILFTQNQRDEVRLMDVCGALAANPGAKQQTFLLQAMRGEGCDSSEDSTGRGKPLVPLAIRPDATPKWNEDIAFTLTQPSPTGGGHPQAIAFHPTQDPISNQDGITHAMGCESSKGQCTVAFGVSELPKLAHCLRSGASRADKHDSTTYVAAAMQVRRLTPRECERLQGFPDDHTLIPWRGKPADQTPDGPRYRSLGNSMAVPVMRWIGERLHRINSMLD